MKAVLPGACLGVHRMLSTGDLRPHLAFLASLPVIVTQLCELIGPAASLSPEVRLTLHDTLYLALAEQQGVPLVSADQTLIDAARKQTRLRDLLVWIGDFTV